MFANSSKLVIGQRVVSSGGATACEACRALHGQEFYYHPRPGQRPMAELPELPLHPNCRCKLMPIFGYDKLLESELAAQSNEEDVSFETYPEDEGGKEPSAVLTPMHTHGGYVLFGVVFGNKGRSLLSGPAYGYYYGQNWMKGRNVTGMSTRYIMEKLPAPPPVDSLDNAAMNHDYNYVRCEEDCEEKRESYFYRAECREKCELEADRIIVQEMRALDDDPAKWPMPPASKGQAEYAKRCRAYAIWFFEGRVWTAEMNRRDQEDGH